MTARRLMYPSFPSFIPALNPPAAIHKEAVHAQDRDRRRARTEGFRVLHAGDWATFPKDTGNGHYLNNKSSATAVYLEVGSRNGQDLTTTSCPES
jgi:uncharacterized cupin superfamily protein